MMQTKVGWDRSRATEGPEQGVDGGTQMIYPDEI